MKITNENLKILLVEDKFYSSNEMETSLTQMGHQVLATLNRGPAVVSFLKDNTPDLAIVDIGLKGVIDSVRVGQLLADADIPIIFSTSSKKLNTFDHVKPLKPVGYIVKPVNKLTLQGCLNQSIYFSNLKILAFWALDNITRKHKAHHNFVTDLV